MRVGSLCLVLLIVTSAISTGCHHTVQRPVIPDELVAGSDEVVLSATLRNGSIVHFNDTGASYYWMTVSEKQVLCIVGETREGKREAIKVADIAEARIRSRKSDAAGSFLVATTVTVAALAGFFIWFLSALGGH